MNYAQMLESGDLTEPLYKDKALTQPFNGTDTLTASTKIYTTSSISNSGSPSQEQRKINVTGLSSFNYSDIVVGLYSTDNFTSDSTPIYYGNATIYSGTANVSLFDLSKSVVRKRSILCGYLYFQR